MQIIAHRRNTIADLDSTPTCFGVEVDIRSYGDSLMIHHDPFEQGTDFIAWLDHYRHRTLILNVKEDGLEQRLLQLMSERCIEDFFFLDQPFPSLVKMARKGERRCAARVSEFENIDTALSLAGTIDWVWVDCFTRFPLFQDDVIRLKNAGFRLCLVSPELQGRDPMIEIERLKDLLSEKCIQVDAVCTKRPDMWTL